jgi:hypothetical protein
MGKKSGSRVNISDQFSERFEKGLWVKKFFLTLDPGWKIPGIGINIPDPQHWIF